MFSGLAETGSGDPRVPRMNRSTKYHDSGTEFGSFAVRNQRIKVWMDDSHDMAPEEKFHFVTLVKNSTSRKHVKTLRVNTHPGDASHHLASLSACTIVGDAIARMPGSLHRHVHAAVG